MTLRERMGGVSSGCEVGGKAHASMPAASGANRLRQTGFGYRMASHEH